MSKVTVEASSLNDIGLALQEVSETSTKYTPSEMGGGVRSFSNGIENILTGLIGNDDESGVNDKLDQLDTIRTSIRSALESKGVSASTHNYENFPDDVDAIQTGGGGTDGQFFPMNMMNYALPTMTLTYNGGGN